MAQNTDDLLGNIINLGMNATGGGGRSYYGRYQQPDLMDTMSKGMGFLNQARGFSNNLELENSSNRLLGLAKERGDMSSLSFNDINSVHDMQAMGNLLRQNAANQEARMLSMQKQNDADTMDYHYNIYPRMNMAMKAFEAGDYDGFAVNAEQLANKLGVPYRLKQDGQGGFDMYFRSDQKLGYTPTGQKLSMQQTYDMMRNLANGTQYVAMGADGQKVAVNPTYNLWAARQRIATERGNIENALNPKMMIGPNGQRVYASVQNQWGDYNTAGDAILFDAASGKKIGQMKTTDLANQGFRYANDIDVAQYRKALGLDARAAGRGGGGGGRGGRRGGTGGAAGGAGVVSAGMGQVSKDDMNLIEKFCTLEKGSKPDYNTVNGIAMLSAATGAPVRQILGKLQDRAALYAQQGKSPSDALRMATRDYLSACQSSRNSEQQEQGQGQTQPQGQAPVQAQGITGGVPPVRSVGADIAAQKFRQQYEDADPRADAIVELYKQANAGVPDGQLPSVEDWLVMNPQILNSDNLTPVQKRFIEEIYQERGVTPAVHGYSEPKKQEDKGKGK